MWILLVFLFYFISATLAVPRLHDAAAADRTRDIVDFLTAGDDIDERDPATGDTALLIAVRHLSANSLRLLLHRGANVNIGDRERNLTPLHVASAVGNPIAVRLLVQFGADVSGIHEDGLAPLHRAASGVTSQHEETVQILIEMGARPDEPTFPPDNLARRHLTPMDLATHEPSRAILRSFLLDDWRRSHFWPQQAALEAAAHASSPWLTVASFTVSGAVEDYTPSMRAAIGSSFALAAGVSSSQVMVSVEAASVLLTVSIVSNTQGAADAAKAALTPALATFDAVAELLPAGMSIHSIPTLAVVERPMPPPVSPPPLPASGDASSGSDDMIGSDYSEVASGDASSGSDDMIGSDYSEVASGGERGSGEAGSGEVASGS